MLLRIGLVLALCAAASARAEEAAEAEAEMAKGEQFLLQLDYEKAIAHFQAARGFAPERPGPYLRLGLTYAAMNRCKEAVEFLDEYLLRKPESPRPEAIRTLNECKQKLAPPPP